MRNDLALVTVLVLSCFLGGICQGSQQANQPNSTTPPTGNSTSAGQAPEPGDSTGQQLPPSEQDPDSEEQEAESIVAKAKKQAAQLIKDAREKATELGESEKAQEVSAGILSPIYGLAEYFSFSWFHWIAFTIMVTGVISYALQLILGKLVVLSQMGFSLSAIFADALGLVISLVGLVLTTQAAAENSDFTTNPTAVISAAVVGVIAGLIFYRWGQSEELQAAKGRSAN